MLTQERLKELLHYDPDTGVFTWNIRASTSIKVGDVAGCTDVYGYGAIRCNGINYKAHRLAWLYVYGEFPIDQIDHINHIRHNNWISNLREATHHENSLNLSKAKNNASGVTGVSWNTHDKRWRADISINKKRVYLGNFLEFADACEARAIAEIENDYHVNHGKQCKDEPCRGAV